MNIPGANLLSIAARVIRMETVQHRAFTGRAVNGAGDYVDTYAAAVDIQGSVQAVPRKAYQQLGLDFSKNYIMLITSADVKVTTRDRTGDLVSFGAKSWKCETDTNWRGMDGFTKILCIEVPQ